MSGRKGFAAGVSKAALKRAGVELRPGDLGSELEADFARAVNLPHIPRPERELCLVPNRQWRSDFVWPEQRLVVEVEGGTHSGGRHTRGRGFAGDCRKYAALTLQGWKVIRVTGEHIKSGEAVSWVEQALGVKP